MVFEQIEQLKKQYTDKYVVVDETRPELRRFQGQTGIIKTVNMSGRALVEFNANLNIGWYDIELDFLKVVDNPFETDESRAKKKAAPAAAKPAAKKPTKSMSVEEMMAAARANKAAPAKESAEAKKPAKSMSVEEMMAAARANKPAAATPAPATPAPATPAPATPEPAAASQGGLPTAVPEIIAYCRRTDGA